MGIQVLDVLSSTIDESVQPNDINLNGFNDGDGVKLPKEIDLTSQKRVTREWIYIPAPNNISFTDTHNWEQGNLGKFRAFSYETVDYHQFNQDVNTRLGDFVEALGGNDQKGNAEDISCLLYTSPSPRD